MLPTWSRRGTVVWVYLWLFCLPCCQWVWCMLVYGRGWYAAFWRCVCMLVWLICRFSRAWMLCRYVCMCVYTVCMLMCVAVIVIEMYMLEELWWNDASLWNTNFLNWCCVSKWCLIFVSLDVVYNQLSDDVRYVGMSLLISMYIHSVNYALLVVAFG